LLLSAVTQVKKTIVHIKTIMRIITFLLNVSVLAGAVARTEAVPDLPREGGTSLRQVHRKLAHVFMGKDAMPVSQEDGSTFLRKLKNEPKDNLTTKEAMPLVSDVETKREFQDKSHLRNNKGVVKLEMPDRT
jgi:hypothetical protein